MSSFLIRWIKRLRQRPEERQLDNLIGAGYARMRWRLDNPISICNGWQKAWNLVRQMARPEMRTVQAFEQAHPNLTHSIDEWVHEFDAMLFNAGLDRRPYFKHCLRYTREFLAQFPDETPNTHVHMLRSQGEALWHLGRRAEAEQVYQSLVQRFPDEGWAYIGWADNYWMYGHPDPKEYGLAEGILQRALSHPNLQDRADVLDRLCDLYSEWDKPDELAQAEAELDKLIGCEASQMEGVAIFDVR